MTKVPTGSVSISLSHHATIEATATLEYAVLEKDLCVYKLTTKLKTTAGNKTPFEGFLADTSAQGFATEESIEAFKEGRQPGIKNKGFLRYCPPESLEDARKRGFLPAFEKWATGNFDVFDLYSEGALELDGIATWDVSSHLIFDRNGEPLPTAIYFSYLSGGFKDGSYDLKKALAVLSKNEQVVAPTPKAGSGDGHLKISKVPYYNAGPGCNTEIEFVFQPTAEQMRKIWAQAKRLNEKYPSVARHEAIFELDLLGLRKAGAARYDNFYKSEEY